jgi:hypothetical protein
VKADPSAVPVESTAAVRGTSEAIAVSRALVLAPVEDADMEYREDLEIVLLSGLPDQERREVLEIIDETTAAKLRAKRLAPDDPMDAGESGV